MPSRIQGKPSAPRPEYGTKPWTCSGCGRRIPITQSPTALAKGEYKHIACRDGFYRPEPGEEAATC